MKRSMLLLLTGVILLFTACSAPPANMMTETTQTAAYRQISSSEAMTMMQTEQDYIILDVRTREEYAAGHIPNAICVPNETIGTSDIPELPDKEKLILVYCRSGRRSKEAAQKLADMGYSNIVEFGGIIDWQGEVTTE